MFKNRNKVDLSPRLKMTVGRGHSQNRILKLSAFFCLAVALVLAGNAVRLVLFDKQLVSSASGETAPQVLGATDVKSKETALQFITYKVQKGDTLFNISQKFNIDWNTLATLNNIKNPSLLKPGDSLKIPQ